VLRIEGVGVDLATFEGALSEGDTVNGSIDAAGVETWNLHDLIVVGGVAELANFDSASDGRVLFKVNRLGDDPASNQDTHFVTGDGSEVFTIDEHPVSASQFEAALRNGARVEYGRQGAVETFALFSG
jgi:hypothetical protein